MPDLSQSVSVLLDVKGAEAFKDVASDAVSSFKDIGDAAADLTDVSSGLADKLQGDVGDSFKDVASSATGAFDDMAARIKAFDDSIESIQTTAEKVGDKGFIQIKENLDEIPQKAEASFGALASLMAKGGEEGEKAAEQIKEKYGSTFTSLIQGGQEWLADGNKTIESYKSAFKDTFDEIKGFAVGAKDAISSIISGEFLQSADTLTGIAGKLASGGIGSITSSASGAKAAMDGLVSGSMEALGGLATGGIALATTALGKFQGALKDSYEAANKFDMMVREIQAVMADDFKGTAQGVSDKMVELSRTIPLPAEQLNRLSVKAIEAGSNTEASVTRMVTAMGVYAVATGTSADKAGKDLLFLKDRYKVAEEDVLTFANVIGTMGDKTKGGTDALVNTLKKVPENAKIGIEGVAGFTVALGKAGMNAREIDGGLQQVFKNGVKNLDKLAAATGMNAEKMRAVLASGDKKSITAMWAEIAEKTADATTGSEKYGKIMQAAGDKGGKVLMTLGKNAQLMRDSLNDAGKAAQNVDGIMGDFATNSGSVEAQMQLLHSAVFEAAEKMGKSLVPAALSVMEAIKPWIPTFVSVAESVGKALGTVVYAFTHISETVKIVSDVLDNVFGKGTADSVKEWGQILWETVRDTFKDIMEFAGRFVKALPDAFLTVIQGITGFPEKMLRAIGLDSMADKMKVFSDTVVGAFKEAFGFIAKVAEVIGQTWNKLSGASAQNTKALNENGQAATAAGKSLDQASNEAAKFANTQGLSTLATGKNAAALDSSGKAMSYLDEGARKMAATNDTVATSFNKVRTAQDIMKEKTLAANDAQKQGLNLQQQEINVKKRFGDELNNENDELTRLKQAREDQINMGNRNTVSIDKEIKMQERKIIATKEEEKTTLANLSIQKQQDVLNGKYVANQLDRERVLAKSSKAAQEAAKSENVLKAAIESTAKVTEAKYKLRETEVKAFADVMKAKYESAAKIVEAESKAIEESMKSLSSTTVEVTKLMSQGWNDYVKAVQNPFQKGSKEIISAFEQQMQMQKELIQAQTKLANEQAESMRFRREKEAKNEPQLIRISTEGAEDAIKELVNRIITEVSIKYVSEGGSLCC